MHNIGCCSRMSTESNFFGTSRTNFRQFNFNSSNERIWKLSSFDGREGEKKHITLWFNCAHLNVNENMLSLVAFNAHEEQKKMLDALSVSKTDRGFDNNIMDCGCVDWRFYLSHLRFTYAKRCWAELLLIVLFAMSSKCSIIACVST